MKESMLFSERLVNFGIILSTQTRISRWKTGSGPKRSTKGRCQSSEKEQQKHLHLLAAECTDAFQFTNLNTTGDSLGAFAFEQASLAQVQRFQVELVPCGQRFCRAALPQRIRRLLAVLIFEAIRTLLTAEQRRTLADIVHIADGVRALKLAKQSIQGEFR